MRLNHLLALAVALMLVAGPIHADAGDSEAGSQGLALELNRLEKAGEACRATLVFRNGLATTIQELELELVLFGPADEVITLLGLDPGRLPPDKTRVRQFDLKATACTAIARVLVNDISRCKGETLSPAACLEALITRSRIDVPLRK